ncbi:MAG: hypothetical protein Q8L52_02120 [bacterium]|nr:hypothetical protein [bacterium]
MTWKRASLVLTIAAVSDIFRYFFLFFWFFGPVFAGLYCATKVGDIALIGSLLAKGCIATAAALGIGGFAIAATFGTVMAMAVGFLGWLAVTFIMTATDSRTFKENPSSVLWLFEGLGASVLVMAWGVYHKQIKTEKAALKKWEEENAAAIAAQRNQQVMQAAQIQAAQRAQFMQQEASNESVFEQAANDEQNEIPEDEKMAA